MSNIGLKPRNQNEIQVMRLMTECHDWLAKELNIQSHMEFGRTAYWGNQARHCGLWYQDTKQSVLNFRNLYGANMYRLLKIIAHEARHAVQYKDNLLSVEGRKSKMTHNGKWEVGYWQGKLYRGPYKEAPWEIDARAHEKQYADLIVKSGIITDKELKMKLSGKQDQIIYLEDETIQDIKNQYGNVSLYKVSVFTETQQKARQAELKKLYEKKGYAAYKKAKKDFNTKYCDKSIAFLTRDEEKKLPKSDRFWAAQKNRIFYKSRPLKDSDLVY
jgi:hypothetical protein|tara:strand:- start:4885 stop:5703 length:819 start_codon:yes stop_codon:yes gene_type:complete